LSGTDNSEETCPMTRLRSSFYPLAFAALLMLGLAARADEAKSEVPPAPAEPDRSKDKPLPEAFDKANPENIDDLKTIEKHVKGILEKVLPATVCVQLGGSSGSGVIVSEDGLILTAAHVSGQPGKDVTVIMPDGKKLKGKSLGGNEGIDSGMMKITEPGKYPFVEMGKVGDMKKGAWCICTGHPGGWHPGRSPVVRVGRILENTPTLVRTDCTLVGGDSGGPLFDMYGRVIGINSRIGPTITSNIHVPVDTFRETWTRLVSSERWGGRGPRNNTQGDPYFGLGLDQVDKDVKIVEVKEGSPAEKAKLKADDIIKKFDGKEVDDVEMLRGLFKTKKPGDKVKFEVERDGKAMTLEVVVGKKEKE
jgi:serine protease Do